MVNAFLFSQMHNSFREVDVLVNVFVRVASAASGQFFAFVLAERMGSRAAAALTVTSIAIKRHRPREMRRRRSETCGAGRVQRSVISKISEQLWLSAAPQHETPHGALCDGRHVT